MFVDLHTDAKMAHFYYRLKWAILVIGAINWSQIARDMPKWANLLFEQINNIPNKPTDDHAIVDDVDVKQLKVILGHEPENKDIADIQDNKTDDDQPDLETDDSSGCLTSFGKIKYGNGQTLFNQDDSKTFEQNNLESLQRAKDHSRSFL